MREFQKKFFDLLDAKQFTEAVLLWELHLKNLNPLSENNCFDIKHILQEAMLSRSDALEIFFISGKSDSKYTTPIVLTYYYAAIKIVEYIIQTHHAKSNDAECYGCVLLLAASKKEWDLCRLLLNQGVKLTYMDAPSKYTALHFLAMSGQTELTMLAIQRGANITAVGRDGKTPLQLAIDKRHWPLLALLVPITDEPSCYAPLLSEAAAAKAWDFCYALLQKQKVTNITALYHFAKHEKLSLAANVIFGNYFYSDEECIFRLIIHFYKENAFNQLDELLRGYCDAENSVRDNLYKETLLKMDLHSQTIYTAALKNTGDNYDEKYKEIRSGGKYYDIDWALCAAIQRNDSAEEVEFLCDNGADLSYAWLGAMICGRKDALDNSKVVGNSSGLCSSVAVFKQKPSSDLLSHDLADAKQQRINC